METNLFLISKSKTNKFLIKVEQTDYNSFTLIDEVSGETFDCYYNQYDNTWRSSKETEKTVDDDGDEIIVNKTIVNEQLITLLEQKRLTSDWCEDFEDESDEDFWKMTEDEIPF